MKNCLFAIFMISGLFGFSQTPFYPTSDAMGFGFGGTLDIDNENIASRTFGNPFMSIPHGKVYVFQNNDGNIVQTNTFYPEDAADDDGYGNSLALENDFLAVGSPYHDTQPEDNNGAVYLYRKVSGNWSFFQKVLPPADAVSSFGSVVRLNGNQLFIKDSGVQISTGNAGSIYVYNFDGNDWIFSQKIEMANSNNLGGNFEVEGNKLLAFSWNASQTQASIHTFINNGTTWEFANSLSAFSDLGDWSLSGDQLAIMTNSISPENAVDFYDYTSGGWEFSQTITTPNISLGQVFNHVELSGNIMLLGSDTYLLLWQHKFPVLLYEKVSGQWIQQTVLYGTGTEGFDDMFGIGMESDGDHFLIGAVYEGEAFHEGMGYYLDIETLGNDDFQRTGAVLYPNPVTNTLSIKTDGINAITKIQLFSITGNLLHTQVENIEDLPMSQLAAGIYFIRLDFANGEKQTAKIIKR